MDGNALNFYMNVCVCVFGYEIDDWVCEYFLGLIFFRVLLYFYSISFLFSGLWFQRESSVSVATILLVGKYFVRSRTAMRAQIRLRNQVIVLLITEFIMSINSVRSWIFVFSHTLKDLTRQFEK